VKTFPNVKLKVMVRLWTVWSNFRLNWPLKEVKPFARNSYISLEFNGLSLITKSERLMSRSKFTSICTRQNEVLVEKIGSCR
jgi:hypothetical protein